MIVTDEAVEAWLNRPECTDSELEAAFARQCSDIAAKWGAASDVTDQQRVDGAITDVLHLLDGRNPDFPQMQLFSPKHGDNDCVVERDGELVRAVVCRFTNFYGGASDRFVELRQEAAKELADE